jgi:multimeric flavodoxin WrbA
LCFAVNFKLTDRVSRSRSPGTSPDIGTLLYKEAVMKATVINGSPHMEKGNTALILDPFVQGMKDAGAEVTIFYTSRLKINPCQGEYNCWMKTPGRCFQKDDMEKVIGEISGSEILVLATPLYVDGMTGPMKTMLDRLIPIGLPLIDIRGGHSRHPGRAHIEASRMVLVSNCGFWELDNFDPLVAHVKAVAENIGRTFSGALLRPHGPALKPMMQQGAPVGDILDAARRAGSETVTAGVISPGTLQSVSRELLPRDLYNEIANQRISEILKGG